MLNILSILLILLLVIFLIGGLLNGFLFVCSDLDIQEVEMRKNISSSSSTEYTEENLDYRISNDTESCAVEVLDIIKEKGRED